MVFLADQICWLKLFIKVYLWESNSNSPHTELQNALKVLVHHSPFFYRCPNSPACSNSNAVLKSPIFSRIKQVCDHLIVHTGKFTFTACILPLFPSLISVFFFKYDSDTIADHLHSQNSHHVVTRKFAIF